MIATAQGAAPTNARGGPPLVAEVMILNKDIGFVREGQEAALKLEAFPFTDYGLIPGRLVQISRDAVEQEGVGLVYTGKVVPLCLGSAAATTRAERLPRTTIRGQTAHLCRQAAAGMAATAEVKTGARRIIDYLLSPIAKAANEAGRER